MQGIHFIHVRCPRCGAEYKVRLERIADRDPIECVSCGAKVDVEPLCPMLMAIYEYKALAVRLDGLFSLDGETAVPKQGVAAS